MVMETREKCRGSLTQPGRKPPSPVDVTAWGEHEHERRDGMLIALHLVKEDALALPRRRRQVRRQQGRREKIDMMHHHDANITSVLHPLRKEERTTTHISRAIAAAKNIRREREREWL